VQLGENREREREREIREEKAAAPTFKILLSA
jgi:hypothetical protein